MKTRAEFQQKIYSLRSIRLFSPEWATLLLIVFVPFITGCQTFYKVNSSPASPEAIAQMQAAKKYIILHEGDEAWHLKDMALHNEQLIISGILETLPDTHQYYKTTNPKYNNPYKPSKGNPTYEVHIYATDHTSINSKRVAVPLQSIEKIEIYDPATGAIIVSRLLGFVGVMVGIVLIVGGIAALSSCPFVYVSDGQNFHFMGEIYGGAIYSCLERDDYMPLSGLQPVQNEYGVKISNELLEKQYTNLAELIVIDHPVGLSALYDKYGTLQTLDNPVAPETALSDTKTDYREVVSRRDHASYLFNDNPDINNKMSSLTLSFPKPKDVRVGKLVLNTQNSLWLDYIYGKFNEQFGTYYPTFAEKQKEVPAEHHLQWSRDQGVSMSVYLDTGKGWEYVDYFNLMGPLAMRDIVMPIDLTHVQGDQVKVMLTCGYMFWEIDYAAMDFSENIPVHISIMPATTAVDETGLDITAQVRFTDTAYLVQPIPGNEATFTFEAPPALAGYERTAILHTRGYYEYVRDYQNKPNLGYLKTFKNREGAFTKFSKERCAEILKQQELIVNASTSDHEK